MEEQFKVKDFDEELADYNRRAKEWAENALHPTNGRYELSDAAMRLDSSSKDATISMLDKLIKAAEMDKLTVYNRGSNQKYQRPKYPTEKHPEVYWEARWNDLNEWLEKNEPLIFEAYQFPKPDAPAANGKAGMGITTHKLRTKDMPLDAEITIAKSRALDMTNVQSVWDELVKMTIKQDGCLIGEGDLNELQYGSRQAPQIFTKKMLTDRMRGRKNRAKPR